MLNSDCYYNKDKVCTNWCTSNQMDEEAASEIYDETIGNIHKYLESSLDARVYIPHVGTIYTEVIPGNPPKVRYRLSCKPHKLLN